MAFKRKLPKTISKNLQTEFWKDWKAGKRIRKKLVPSKERTAIAVSPASIGTIRRFDKRSELLDYKIRNRIIENAITKARPKMFELDSVQFFGQRGKNLLERVYRAPNLWTVMTRCKSGIVLSRYWKPFETRLKKRGYSFETIRGQIGEDAAKLEQELNEMHAMLLSKNVYWDNNNGNILILDYDPKKRKFQITLVDIGGSLAENIEHENS